MRFALGDYTGVATNRRSRGMLDRRTGAVSYEKEAKVMGMAEEYQRANKRGGRSQRMGKCGSAGG